LSWKTKHHTALGTPYFGCGYAALCFKGVGFGAARTAVYESVAVILIRVDSLVRVIRGQLLQPLSWI
jgi:hypothetical protein